GEDDLVVVAGEHAADRVPGRLWLVRDDGHLLTNQSVDQAGLPHVRPTDHGDDPGAEHRTGRLGPYPRSSTLAGPHPSTRMSRRPAPTKNRPYGAYARSLAAQAARMSSSYPAPPAASSAPVTGPPYPRPPAPWAFPA